MRIMLLFICLFPLGCGDVGSYSNTPPPGPAPVSPAPIEPEPRCPDCPDNRCPKPRPRFESVGAAVGGNVSPDGTEYLQLELPGGRHQKNSVGTDGSGLCVYASAKHTGDWQSDAAFYGLFEYMKLFPGGSYPEKFDKTLAAYCKEKNLAVPKYVQVQDNNLDVLITACQNRMMPGVTYSRSPTGRYQGQKISHMVTLVHATKNWFAVLDNNYIGENSIEWMKPDEFLKTYSGTSGKGWCIVLLTDPPPPAPFSRNLQ